MAHALSRCGRFSMDMATVMRDAYHTVGCTVEFCPFATSEKVPQDDQAKGRGRVTGGKLVRIEHVQQLGLAGVEAGQQSGEGDFLMRPYRGAAVSIAHVMSDIREFAWVGLPAIPEATVQQQMADAFAEDAEGVALAAHRARSVQKQEGSQ